MAKTFGSNSEGKLPDDFLEPLNFLTLQSNIIVKETEEEKKTVGKKNKNAVEHKKRTKPETERAKAKRKQEKKLKKELTSELKEAEAVIDPKRVEHFKTEILGRIFYIYFKILKSAKLSKFFPAAMNGILKFLHMISSNMLGDLIFTLGQCGDRLREHHLKHMDQSKVLLHSRITCIFASIEIIGELGKAVELDDKEAILSFYQLFLDFSKFPKLAKVLKLKDQFLLVKSLHKIFIKKRQLSLDTTASFLKMFLDVTYKFGDHAPILSKTLMFFSKLIMQKYTTLTRLLEEENEGYGLDLYNPKMEDPQATNALRTYIVEDLKNILKKYPKDSEIQTFAKKIIGQERLPTNIASMTPIEFFRKFYDEQKGQ